MTVRKQYIDLEKTILIINVLIIHLIFIYGDSSFLRVLHRLCIPQFALLCGYNINFNINKPFFKTWLKTISFIFFIYFWSLLFTYIVFENSCDIRGTIKLMLSGYFHPKYNMPIWYAPYYISLWTIAVLLLKFVNLVSIYIGRLLVKEKYFSYELLIIFSIICASIGFSYVGNNAYFIKQALVTMPHVFIGYVLFRLDGLYDKTIKKYNFKEKILLSSFILLIVLILSYIFYDLSNNGGTVDIALFIIENISNFYITTIIGGLCLFVICKFICSIKFIEPFIQVVSYIGSKSMYICCFHQITQAIVFDYYKDLLNSYNGSSLYLVLSISLTIITTIVLSFAFEREK